MLKVNGNVEYKGGQEHCKNEIVLENKTYNRQRAIGYGLDDLGVGVRVPVGSSIFSSPNRPDRL
jgi:hypothetical protein